MSSSNTTPITNVPVPLLITTSPSTNTRLTARTSTSYSTILTRFHALVPQISLPTLKTPADRASFETTVSSQIGPHGFALFYTIDHTKWITFYPSNTSPDFKDSSKGPNNGRPLTRFIFGNPLIAITMIKEDVEAGLFAPIEMLLTEEQDGGTRCVAMLPSGLIAGHEAGRGNKPLVEAVAELDRKLLALIEELMK